MLLKITISNNSLYKKMNSFKFKLFLFGEYFTKQCVDPSGPPNINIDGGPLFPRREMNPFFPYGPIHPWVH